MKRILFIVLLAVVLILSGCSTAPETAEPAEKAGFSEVYNDGITIIETGRLLRLPGSRDDSEYCFLETKLTNNGTSPIYYSSMLCLSASSGDSTFSLDNVTDAVLNAKQNIDGFSTLDGVIDPGSQAQGFIVFEAPSGTKTFDIRLATDFGRDEWVSFTCAVS